MLECTGFAWQNPCILTPDIALLPIIHILIYLGWNISQGWWREQSLQILCLTVKSLSVEVWLLWTALVQYISVCALFWDYWGICVYWIIWWTMSLGFSSFEGVYHWINGGSSYILLFLSFNAWAEKGTGMTDARMSDGWWLTQGTENWMESYPHLPSTFVGTLLTINECKNT